MTTLDKTLYKLRMYSLSLNTIEATSLSCRPTRKAMFATLQWSSLQHSDDDTPKINCAKSTIFDPPPIWRSLKISPPKTKSGETNALDLPSCKFSRRSMPDICPRAKIHIFPYRGLPYIFRKLSSSWLMTCSARLIVLEIFAFQRAEIVDLRDPMGIPPPK